MVVRKPLCLALMFCVIWRRASATEAKITIDPELLDLDHDLAEDGDIVTVSCEAIGVLNANDILSMWIDRTTATHDTEHLVKDRINTDREVFKSEMTATGSTSEMKLTLTMSKTKCVDAGNYTCGVFVDTTQFDSLERLYVEVSPGPVDMTATQSKQSYTVNETLVMLCNGPVGTVNGDTQVSWVWKYKDTSSPNSLWQTVGDSDGQIEDVDSPLDMDCYQVRKSRLTRVLTLADSGRMYRCIVKRNNEEYTQFAGNYTIESVTEEVATTTVSTSGGEAKKSNIGGIVGGIVGALVAVIVVIVIIVFVMKRRKSNREEECAPDDHGNKPGDNPNGAPFTTDPGVMYSAPHPHRNDREAGEDRERERGGRTNADGLHYADLDLVRKPPQDDSTESVQSRTEYASIRLF